MEYILVLLGFVMLFIGGETLISGASEIAYRLRIPAVIVGIFIVGFGTSVPELLVSIQAALQGIPSLAMGNVIGSNIANILLILGVSSLIAPIIIEDFKSLKRDMIAMAGATILLVIITYLGYLDRMIGLVLCGLTAFYAYLTYQTELKNPTDSSEEALDNTPLKKSVPMVLFGIVLLAFGPKFLIEGGTIIAKDFGLSEAVIGLTMVAIGTSLPELATGISASLKKQSGILIGNVLGSNIFNILLILGVTSIIKPFEVESRFLQIDAPIIMISTLSLIVLLCLKSPLRWWVGIIYLPCYIAYMISMV